MDSCREDILEGDSMSLNEKIITFKVRRFEPESKKSGVSTYRVPVRKGMTILDALLYIRDHIDGTLTFRCSCRMGICGSCAVLANGKPVLACYTQVLETSEDMINITPLRNFQTIKDLVTEIEPFKAKFKTVKPYLIKSDEEMKKEVEFPQKPEEMSKYWDLSLCIKCAICYSACPAYIDESFLGPAASATSYRFTIDSRDEGCQNRPSEVASSLWLCTSCNSCTLSCPKKVDGASSIIGLKSLAVESGLITRTVKDVLTNTYRYHNEFGVDESKRSEWYSDLGLKEISGGQKYDLVYFVCCSQAYDARNQKAAKALVSTLKKADIDFAMIGTEEWCCGDHIMRLGEKGLFDELSEHNKNMFECSHIKRLFTTSPHCYNTFKNDKPYSEIGIEVQHYTEIISNAIEQGKLKPSKSLGKTVTYHDPCFLGKRNNIYEPPRKILESVPGLLLVEMDRVKENSFCCGGGAGRVWTEEAPADKRPSINRLKQALETNAEIVATACPFCITMLEDAAKGLGVEEKIRIVDVIELLNESL